MRAALPTEAAAVASRVHPLARGKAASNRARSASGGSEAGLEKRTWIHPGALVGTLVGATVAEGAFTAPVLARLAATRGIDMPIVAAVDGLLAGHFTVDQVLEQLLARPPRAEAI